MADIVRYPYVEDFIKFLHERMQAARITIEIYSTEVKAYYDWFITNHGHNDLQKILTADIINYRNYLEQQQYSHSTMVIRFSALSTFFSYLIQSEILAEDKDPWPKRLHLKGEKSRPHFLPSPNQIFQIRLKQRVRLEWAWYFELALSTGMRADEIAQLRAADFNYNKRPYDSELGYLSPYFVGSINLAVDRIKTKNKQPRVVYFSQLAAKLTRELLAKNNIAPDDGLTPLIPWTRSSPQDWLMKLGKGIVNKEEPGQPEEGEMRDRYFMDLDADMLNTSEQFKKIVKRRQEENAGIEQYKLQASQPKKHRKKILHPHCLRHSFTCFMYYRTMMGERQASDSVRILLGHVGYNTLTTYLTRITLIDNDLTWKRLWIGKPQDWNGINR